MANKTESATYIHGHHASVIRSHSQRTALNSASFLLPHLKPNMKILDIGCGPGTITVDLATYVPDGHVTGLERAGSVLTQAQTLTQERGLTNVAFVEGDANALSYADGTFDVVFCHQVLQHVGDPVGVLREMRRVVRAGGVVAAREADYSSFAWYPELGALTEWLALYARTARRNGGEPNAGRMIHVWAKRAGFAGEDVRCSVSSWCFVQKDEVRWWSETWQERALHSAFATTAVEAGFATLSDLERMSKAWKEWGDHEDAWLTIPSSEIICYKH